MKCGYCRKPTGKDPLVCGQCHLIAYCGDACADADWYAPVNGHARDHEEEEEHTMDLILGSGAAGEGSIFLGSVDALRDPKAMSHIDAVVSVLGENYDNDEIEKAVDVGRNENNRRWHLRITIWDSPEEDIAYYFEAVANWIHRHMVAGRHLLIHCVAGHSRSTTLLIYYMLKHAGFESVDEALSYIQERRPTAGPNEGFMEQLRENPGHMNEERLKTYQQKKR